MKTICLDCDGVINSESFYENWFAERGFSEETTDEFRNTFYYHNGFEGYVVPEMAKRVCEICDETNSMILWSSNWRIGMDIDKAAELFKAKGLPYDRLIGITPNLNNTLTYIPRCLEIKDWLAKNKKKFEIELCAVIDDDIDAGIQLPQKCKYFQTYWEYGLTEEIKNDIILYLNKGE